MNPYLGAGFHDEDLHDEWNRLDHNLHAAHEAGDEDLRDSLAMQRDQVAEAIRLRTPGPITLRHQLGSRDPSPLQTF
jgi:DNA-directed RNA polymerase sigma subunit (sigma70/sigma32)